MKKKKTYVAPEATPNDFTIALLVASTLNVGGNQDVVENGEHVGYSKKFGTALWEDMK